MASSLLASTAGLALRQSLTRGSVVFGSRAFASATAQASGTDSPTYEVPAGHAKSDLSSTACNIGLNRRRDLTLRQDIRLYRDGKPETLGELFHGNTSIVFGVPDMGKICSATHAPGFLAKADELKAAGVQKIWSIALADPAAASEWSKKVGIDGTKVGILSDKTGAFSRMLGVELISDKPDGPKTHRYAALIEDGILIKLKVDDSPADVKKSSAESVLGVIKELKALK